MNAFYNRHYIATVVQGQITDGWSDGPCPDRDTVDAVCINDQGGYQFRFFPGGAERPVLYTADGILLYHWEGGLCFMCLAADIMDIGRAAIVHKLYQATYYSRLAAWVRRCETGNKMQAITCGKELLADLAAILAAAGGENNAV